jgi:hypothetical protein
MMPLAAPLPGAAHIGLDDAEAPWPGDLVTVAQRFNSLEAELLRGRLCADGIPATLADAHTVQTDTLLTAALGGVRVRVPESFVEAALRTIAAVDAGAFMLADDEPAGDPAPEDTPSANTSPALAAAAGLLLLGVLAAFLG